MKRLLALLALTALAASLAACATGNAAEPSFAPPVATPGAPSPGEPGGPATIRIVADNMVFEQREVVVPANTPLTIEFENREGPPHNVAIYTDASAATVVYRGELFTGPASRTYTVPPIAPGSYFFRCDAHPMMTGTIVAR